MSSGKRRERRKRSKNNKNPKSLNFETQQLKNVTATTAVGPTVQRQKMKISPSKSFSQTQTATLANIKDMFSGMAPDLIEQIYVSLKCDSMKTIDYILENKNQNNGSDKKRVKEEKIRTPKFSENSEATLIGIPIDAYLHICEHLDLFSFGKLSVVCRTLEIYTQTAYERTSELNFDRHRHWKDGKILAMIAKFPSLKYLSLRKCVDFDSFKFLPESLFASAATIKSLNFAQCHEMRDEDLSDILEILENLQTLDVSQSLVSDDTIELLVQSPALVELNLADCRRVSSKAVKRLIMNSKTLERLNLQGTEMNSEIFDAFNQNVPLRYLNLTKCKRLSTCIMGSKNCQIKELILSNNISLRNVELWCPALTTLNLSSCKYLVSFTMHLAAPGFESANLSGALNLSQVKIPKPSNLREVSLFSCRSLTPESLTQIISSATHSLSSINCGAMIQLNYRMLKEILQTCPWLTEMGLTGCRGLPTAAVKAAHEVLTEHAIAIKQGAKDKAKLDQKENKSRTPDRGLNPEKIDIEQNFRQESKNRTPDRNLKDKSVVENLDIY